MYCTLRLTRHGLLLAVAQLLCCLSACSSDPLAEEGRSAEQRQEFPVAEPDKLDILFVIDNSPGMRPFQESLAANFSRFIDILASLEGGLPSLHIAVISADLGSGTYQNPGCTEDGDDGIFQRGSGEDDCSSLEDSYIIESGTASGNGKSTKNYTGTLADAFNCIAKVGNQGCEFQQPLEAMRRALERQGSNAGFLRPDAYLAVYIVTNKDDCSAEGTDLFDNDPSLESIESPLGFLSPFRCFEFGVACSPDTPRVSGEHEDCHPRSDSPYMRDVLDYTNFLKGLKEDPGKVIVGVIRGPEADETGENLVRVALDGGRPQVAPSCCVGGFCDEPANPQAIPAVRLDAFVSAFPQRNTSANICDDNTADVFTTIAARYFPHYLNPCMGGDLVLADGLPTCIVADVQHLNQDGHVETLLPTCNDSKNNVPCYRFELDRQSCAASPTSLAIVIERGDAENPTATTVVTRCELN